MPCHATLSSPLRDANGIIFDSAAGVAGDVVAPEITHMATEAMTAGAPSNE